MYVANTCKLFHTYKEMVGGSFINGLGGKSKIIGRRSIKLKCKTDDSMYTVWLHDVAHVSEVLYNLLLLARADDTKCKYMGENCILKIYSPTSKLLMMGHKA